MCAASTNCFTGDQTRAFLFLAHETPGRKSLRMLHSNFKLCPASKLKKRKKKLHLNTITRVPFLLTAAQKNIMAPIVWKPAAICHIIMSAAALIRNPLGKVSEVASAIASSHTSVLLHIWNFICLLSQHRFPHSNCLFWERGLNVWWEETWVFDPYSSDHRWDWVTEKKGSAQWQ